MAIHCAAVAIQAPMIDTALSIEKIIKFTKGLPKGLAPSLYATHSRITNITWQGYL